MQCRPDLWTHEQLAGAAARVAAGVRVDVPGPMPWMQVWPADLNKFGVQDEWGHPAGAMPNLQALRLGFWMVRPAGLEMMRL